MHDLKQQLKCCLQGRVCLVGLGNADYGDDALGVRLAERLLQGERNFPPGSTVLIAGTSPERHQATLCGGRFEHVIFLDAVDVGAAPGSACTARR